MICDDLRCFQKPKIAGDCPILLPSESEEKEVLGVGSIPVAILPSWQDMISLNYNCIHMNIVG